MAQKNDSVKTSTKSLLKKGIKYIKKPIELLSDNHKQKYNRVLDLLSIAGIEDSRVTRLELDLQNVRILKSPKERLASARELVRLYPNHPLSHLELAQCLHTLSDPHEFEQMDRYGEVRREWLESSGLRELGLEFINIGNVIGSLGNHDAIECLLRANQLGLRTANKPVLLLPKNARLRNPALFSYFKPHLCVFRDHELITSLRRLEVLLTLPIGLCLPLNEGCPFNYFVHNRLEMEIIKQGVDSSFFTLTDHHWEMGMQVLKQLGVPEDAWYVTLHVREPGYRGETRENTTENWRNANPLDYIKAVEAVTSAGGWVFRMGDPSMTPLPSMPHVIDYAHHEIRCDWMDIFLGATCRFLIGTSSGYLSIPAFFNVPRILTNNLAFYEYYCMWSQDLYLPRWLKKKESGSLLTFQEYMSPPTSTIGSSQKFKDAQLESVENTPEELEAATREMLERTAGSTSLTKFDDELQRRFKTLAESYGFKYHGRPVKAFAPISRDFLERHADLLEGIN